MAKRKSNSGKSKKSASPPAWMNTHFGLLGLHEFSGRPRATQKAIVAKMIKGLGPGHLDSRSHLPEIIEMRAMRRMTHAQIARKLNVSEPAIGSVLCRHRPRMRKFIRSELAGGTPLAETRSPFRLLSLPKSLSSRAPSARTQRSVVRAVIRRLSSRPIDRKGHLPQYLSFRAIDGLSYEQIGAKTGNSLHAPRNMVIRYRSQIEKLVRSELEKRGLWSDL